MGKRRRAHSDRPKKRARTIREDSFTLLQLTPTEIFAHPQQVLEKIPKLAYASNQQQKDWWVMLLKEKANPKDTLSLLTIMEASLLLTSPSIIESIHREIAKLASALIGGSDSMTNALCLLVTLCVESTRGPKLRQVVTKAHLRPTIEEVIKYFSMDAHFACDKLIELMAHFGASFRPQREAIFTPIRKHATRLPPYLVARASTFLAFRPHERQILLALALQKVTELLRSHLPSEFVGHFLFSGDLFSKEHVEGATWMKFMSELCLGEVAQEVSDSAPFQPYLAHFLHIYMYFLCEGIRLPCLELPIPLQDLGFFFRQVGEIPLTQESLTIQYTSSRVSTKVMKDMFASLFQTTCSLAANVSTLCRERILHLLPSFLSLFQQSFVFQSLSKNDQLRLSLYESLIQFLQALGANGALSFQDLLTEIIEQDLSHIMALEPEKEKKSKSKKKQSLRMRIEFQDSEKIQLTVRALRLLTVLYSGPVAVFDRAHRKRIEVALLNMMAKILKDHHPLFKMFESDLYFALSAFVCFSGTGMRVASIPYCKIFLSRGLYSGDPKIVEAAHSGLAMIHRGDPFVPIPLPLTDEMEMEIEHAYRPPSPTLQPSQREEPSTLPISIHPSSFIKVPETSTKLLQNSEVSEPSELKDKIATFSIPPPLKKPKFVTGVSSKSVPKKRKRESKAFTTGRIDSSLSFGDLDGEDSLGFLKSLGLELRTAEVKNEDVVPLFQYYTDTT